MEGRQLESLGQHPSAGQTCSPPSRYRLLPEVSSLATADLQMSPDWGRAWRTLGPAREGPKLWFQGQVACDEALFCKPHKCKKRGWDINYTEYLRFQEIMWNKNKARPIVITILCTVLGGLANVVKWWIAQSQELLRLVPAPALWGLHGPQMDQHHQWCPLAVVCSSLWVGVGLETYF